MVLELIKQTTKITGANYWFVRVDGEFQSSTWTSDPDKAVENFNALIESAKKYPETTEEVISTSLIMEKYNPKID